MLGIGTPELAIILGIVLVVFGPKRLPELARMLAKATKMFHEASREIQRQLEMSEWEEEQRTRKLANKSKAPQPQTTYEDESEYGDGYYGAGTSIDESASGSSESSTDESTVVEAADSGISETTVTPAPPIEPKPEPIDDPQKTGDAQRYSREMAD